MECSKCNGSGLIEGGSRVCPDCLGRGFIDVVEEIKGTILIEETPTITSTETTTEAKDEEIKEETTEEVIS